MKKIKIKKNELEVIDGELFVNGKKADDKDVRKFKNFIFSHLYNGVTEDEFLTFKGGTYYFYGKKMDKNKMLIIKEQADILKKSELLGMIFKEMNFLSNKKMFDESKTPEDLLAGKMLLYNIEVLSKKILKLSELNI